MRKATLCRAVVQKRASILVRFAAVAAFASGMVSSANQTPSEPDIYYSYQAAADAALVQFDRDNPQCQLWTNWQRMCSRTGNNGETSCIVDAGRRVRPSVPFCVASQGAANINSRHVGFASASRFCRRFEQIMIYGADQSRLAASQCAEYQRNRPFAVFDQRTTLSRWCGAFRTRRYRNGYTEVECTRPTLPEWCSAFDTTNGRIFSRSIVLFGENDINTEGMRRRNYSAVSGFYCSMRIDR